MAGVATQLRLTSSDDEVLLAGAGVTGDSEIFTKSFDLGFPSPREFTQPRSGKDGQYDLSELFGGRTVQIDLWVTDNALTGETRHEVAQRLRKMAAPRRRTTLYVTYDSASNTEMMMTLRGSSVSYSVSQAAHSVLEISLTFYCASGVLESSNLFMAQAYPSFANSGLEFDDGGVISTSSGTPIAAGPSTAIGILNEGSLKTPVLFRFLGPGTSPKITRVGTDEFGSRDSRELHFPNYVVPDGGSIEIDTDGARIVSSPVADAVRYLSASSYFFDLLPGHNDVQVTASGATVNTALEIYFRQREI